MKAMRLLILILVMGLFFSLVPESKTWGDFAIEVAVAIILSIGGIVVWWKLTRETA